MAFYSWPSKAKLTGYNTADEATIEASEKYRDTGNEIKILQEIDDILANLSGDLKNLPEEIQRKRNAATEDDKKHIGHNICLLWENPLRIPTNQKLNIRCHR